MNPVLSFLVFVVVFSFLSFSCNRETSESSEKKPEYLASFYARYLEDDGQIKAEVKLRPYDSERKDYWEPVEKGVLLDGVPLPERDMGSIGSVYTRTVTGIYVPSHKIEVKGQLVTLATPKASSIAIEGEASKSNGFRITWDGPVLAENETLVILIIDSAGKTFTLNRLGPSQATNTPVLKEQLTPIATGKATLRVVRKLRSEIKEGDVLEGVGLSEYYSSSTSFSLTD